MLIAPQQIKQFT